MMKLSEGTSTIVTTSRTKRRARNAGNEATPVTTARLAGRPRQPEKR
jgi:hypothetical protein